MAIQALGESCIVILYIVYNIVYCNIEFCPNTSLSDRKYRHRIRHFGAFTHWSKIISILHSSIA